LRVVFLDVERPSPALEKLKRQLAEAEAALETRKKPPVDTGPRVVGEGLVIDEWVCISCLVTKMLNLLNFLILCSSLTLVSFRKSEGRNTWLGNRLK
jgi:hypothetical protein